jgi:hypothetical protein
MFNNLFEPYGYIADVTSIDDVVLFKNEKSTQFYFVAEYSENDFLGYEDAIISENVINLYTARKETNPAIVKNSSLITLVRCASYQPSQELLNKIYAVEEDPFGMRKYVVAAQGDIIDQLKSINLDELRNIIRNKDRFDAYQSSGLANSDHEYMGAIQLYIKLPFLKIEEGRAQLQTISERVQVLMQKDSNQHLKDQSLVSGGIFYDREKFLSNALSLEPNELDEWLNVTLGKAIK